MRVSIMQPGYIPWLGFFDLMKRSHLFVIYDDVKYTKNDWRNRNRIKTPQGECWLTIPVPKDSVRLKIKNVFVEDFCVSEHLQTIRMAYKQAAYYEEVCRLLFREDLIMSQPLLINYLMYQINRVKEYLNLPCDMCYSSEIGFQGYNKTERLILMLQRVGATEYLSPNGALPYLDKDLFARAGIRLLWQDYEHPVYNQLWGDFVPNMSIIDLLFNHGKESVKII